MLNLFHAILRKGYCVQPAGDKRKSNSDWAMQDLNQPITPAA